MAYGPFNRWKGLVIAIHRGRELEAWRNGGRVAEGFKAWRWLHLKCLALHHGRLRRAWPWTMETESTPHRAPATTIDIPHSKLSLVVLKRQRCVFLHLDSLRAL